MQGMLRFRIVSSYRVPIESSTGRGAIGSNPGHMVIILVEH
jgi:hypothetical protein